MSSIPWGDVAICAAVALPMLGNWLTQISATANQKGHTALARVTGMASQEAASIARALSNLPANASPELVEMNLINASVDTIVSTIRPAVLAIGGNPQTVQKILQGELDKLALTGRASPSTAPPAANGIGTGANTLAAA
jgi:hypothetical protein